MVYRFLADGVVVLHFLWILFLIFGALWGKKDRTVRMVHVSGLVFAFFLEVCGWYCPLTYLEVWLREKQDPAYGYTGSCIAHYLEKLVYLQLPRGTIVALTVLIIIFNGWVYLHKKSVK